MNKVPGDSRLPRHVAVIMDGNGRWASRRGLPRLKGHEEGAHSVTAIVRACHAAGVRYLTLYAFSSENWRRPASEVRGLMRLLLRYLGEYEKEFMEKEIRLRLLGHIEDLPSKLKKELERVAQATRKHTRADLLVALSYSARAEIADAARALAAEVAGGRRRWQSIDETALAGRMYAPDVPDPDLLIRTSGEQRLSNFLLWQLSYSELYFTKTLWPDFREPHFQKALAAYASRHRRYGRVEPPAC